MVVIFGTISSDKRMDQIYFKSLIVRKMNLTLNSIMCSYTQQTI